MAASITRCPSCGKKNRVPADAAGSPRCGSCSASLPWIVDVSDADWIPLVEESPLPVVADFWADWCGPCRAVGPVLEQLAGEFGGRIKLAKIDVDRSPGLSRSFDIRGIPALAVFDRGRLVSRRTGAAGPDDLRRWIEEALASSGATPAPG